MAAAPAPNPRASLLSGLRTGGVRSASTNVPHTAAPGGHFNLNLPRFSITSEENDTIGELSQTAKMGANRHIPMTAAVDGPGFSQQQAAKGMNPNSAPFSPAFAMNVQSPAAQLQAQAMQMQMMQLEIMRLQAQQYQAEVIAQAQRQNRQSNYQPPSTAGPLNHTFDLRASALRRATQTEQFRSKLDEDQVPMTAALGGRFGSRTASASARVDHAEDTSTTVISGGTPLGTATPLGNGNVNNIPAPSKSDAAVSWRRGSNSVLGRSASPSVKITPPPTERVSPPPALSSNPRPVPLRLNPVASQPLPEVVIEDAAEEEESGDTASSTESYKSGSPPTSPPSSTSSNEAPASPREEAAKKLYAGLGIGRPYPSTAPSPAHTPVPATTGHRMVSQPMRQPRGPPSGADELGPKNFATRIRRKAIGGLGALMGARERREIVEAF